MERRINMVLVILEIKPCDRRERNGNLTTQIQNPFAITLQLLFIISHGKMADLAT